MSLFAPTPSDWHLPSEFRMFTWIEPDAIGACIFPQTDLHLAELAGLGVTLLINLHERAHSESALAHHGLAQLHLPVPDMSPPAPDQIDQGLLAIERTISGTGKVVVHCAAGLGRTGTLLACHFVTRGLEADQAIAHIRALRPGSIESDVQVAAVRSFGRRRFELH